MAQQGGAGGPNDLPVRKSYPSPPPPAVKTPSLMQGPSSETFQQMLDSVSAKHSFPSCVKILVDAITLDPGFKAFYQWALSANVPVVVLSSGMVPIIRALLLHLVGPDAEKIEIVSNNTSNEGEGPWDIVFHDDSGFGHDKSLAIRPYAQAIAKMPESEQPTLLYAGDGVSDLSAASETDLLFAKVGRGMLSMMITILVKA